MKKGFIIVGWINDVEWFCIELCSDVCQCVFYDSIH